MTHGVRKLRVHFSLSDSLLKGFGLTSRIPDVSYMNGICCFGIVIDYIKTLVDMICPVKFLPIIQQGFGLAYFWKSF